MSNYIDIEDYTSRGSEGPADLGAAMVRAAYGALAGTVTYVCIGDGLIAAVVPPEAGERYEHGERVVVQARQREETVPVTVRTEPRRRRRWGWSPFEGIF